MEFEIVASRVVLLNDGLMVLATVPNEYYQIVMSEKKSVVIKATPEPGMVIVRIGKVIIRLTPTVFEHVVATGKIFVYLSSWRRALAGQRRSGYRNQGRARRADTCDLYYAGIRSCPLPENGSFTDSSGTACRQSDNHQ